MLRELYIVLLVFSVITPQSVFSEDLELDPHLSKLELGFEIGYAELNLPVTRLNGSFRKALDRLFKSESGAGHLDRAIQVKKELEEFGNGIEFNSIDFSKRATKNADLEKVRQTYASERERLRSASQGVRGKLAVTYRKALQDYELAQTKLGKVEIALVARKLREALDIDPRFVDGVGGKAFNGVIHFVAKGEVEIQLKGARVSFRNKADERDKYIDGKSRPQMLKVGDVLRIRMRSNTVFRSLIMTIESEDEKVAIPFKLNDYRYLVTEPNGKDMKIEDIFQIEDRPDSGSPDVNMADMWKEKKLSSVSRKDSEWVKIGAGSDWHTYFVVIEKGMLLPTK